MTFKTATNDRVDKTDFAFRYEVLVFLSGLPKNYTAADFGSLTIYCSSCASAVSRSGVSGFPPDLCKLSSQNIQNFRRLSASRNTVGLSAEKVLCKKTLPANFALTCKNRRSFFAAVFVPAYPEFCVVALQASFNRGVDKVHASLRLEPFFLPRDRKESGDKECLQ